MWTLFRRPRDIQENLKIDEKFPFAGKALIYTLKIYTEWRLVSEMK